MTEQSYHQVLDRIATALEAIAKYSKPPRRNPLEHAVPRVLDMHSVIRPVEVGADRGFTESQPLH